MTKTISQRIALTGSEEIRKQLGQLGEWGEKAFRDIQAAAEKLRGPGAAFARNMDAARKRVRELGAEFDKVGTRIRNFGAGVSVGLTAPLVLAAKQSVTAWNEQVDAIQKVEAALASTRGVSGQTSEGLQRVASDLQGITTYGDEAVLAMQAVLLTFTNVRGQTFEQATTAVLNMSTALGMDLQSAALQVGKALNDPRQGVTALSRAGIQFSDVQKANIRQMVEMGDVAGAQGVILKELEVQFGGIAEAMAKTPTGQWTVAMNALGDALEQVGAIITPYITQVAAAIREAALAFQALPESARTTIVVIAGLLAVLGPILVSIGFMVQGLGALATGFAGIMGVAASFTGVLMSLAGGWNVVLTAMRGILVLVAGMLSWPVALGAAFGLLAVTVALHWDEIVAATADALTALDEAAQSAMDSVKDWFGSAFDWIADKIRGVLEWAVDQLEAIQEMMRDIFSGGSSGGTGSAPGFAGGGRVRGPGTSTSDSILAHLSTGEFVVRASAVRHYGAELFERLNAMRMSPTLIPAFAGGGLVVPLPAEAGDGGAHATLNLTIGGETFRGLTAPRETAERLIRFATAEESKKAGRRPAWFEGGLMLYRTEDLARWGVGKGSNLEPGEIDGNFWELAERLVAVEAFAGAAAKGIANIGVIGSQMTVYLEDGTALGPYTLPVAMIRYRGDWTAATAYNEMDLVTVPSVGVYLVLADHTSGATFDALAENAEGDPLYRWLFPMGSGGSANISDEGGLVAAAPGDINFVGDGVTVTDEGDGTITVTIPGSGGALDGLTDVTITAPADGHVLRFDGAGFVNAQIAWGDIGNVPATFAPSPHTHAWSEITGRPGLLDLLPADVGASGQVLKVSAGAIVWGTDDTGGGTGGGSSSVSDEGAQILAAPTDLNFAGAGVTVTDDGDGTITITIPGGASFGGALNDLSDVTIAGPAAGQFLRFDGNVFINAAVDWSDLANVPATFAPAAHTHAYGDLTEIPATFAPVAHTHAWGDLTGVPATFAPSAHQHPWSDLTGVPATFAPAAHTHPASEIEGAVVETIAGAAYTPIAADHRKWKRTTSETAITVTIAANVNAAEDEITFQQGAGGQITFAAGAGLTLSTSGTLVTAGPGAVVGIKFLSATEATLFGHTTAAGGGGDGGSGDMTAAVYDPTSIAADAFARSNHHGEQGIGTVTGLQAALDAKAAAAHTHAIADTTALQAALDAKAPAAHAHAIADTTGLQAALDSKATAEQGSKADTAVQPGLLATVATSGSYDDLSNKPDLSAFDDVEQYTDLAAFPVVGDPAKFYLAQDTGTLYRWTGTVYAVISAQLALGETAETAYRGDRGKAAYDHSLTAGNPHGTTKADVGLGNVDNTSDADKPVSTATQTALDAKAPAVHGHAIADTTGLQAALDDKQPLAAILSQLAALGLGDDGKTLGVASGALAWLTGSGSGSALGVDQTWQDMGGQRAGGTIYQNTTSRTIGVAIRGRSGITIQVSADGSTGWIHVGQFDSAQTYANFAVVPAGWFYRTQAALSAGFTWAELR